jgi:FAD/FMN-containing dehydrogenase
MEFDMPSTPITSLAVLRPGDAGYDAARATFNLAIDQRPAAIALPRDAGEVRSAVALAAEHGLRVAPQRTGHNAGPLGALERTMLLRTDALDEVTIDVEARTARVGAGVRWADVVPAASAHGLAALHGSTPDVSVVGYTLGGGLGWYAREHGLAANHVRAIEIVTADGALRRVDADHEPHLFWALRGGGGNFGVVTAIEFALIEQPEVYAGALFFPWERAGEVLHAWHDWTAHVPESVTSVGRILQFPPLPDIPQALRGNAFVVVEAVSTAGAFDLEALRALGPVMDTFATVAPEGIAELHMDPRDPIPYAGEHRLLGDLPAAAIDAFVALAGPGSGSPMLSIELRHLGGAVGRAPAGAGATGALRGTFCLFAVGVTPTPAAAGALRARFAEVVDALRPYEAGRFFSFTEEATAAAGFYADDVLARLRAVKDAVDPSGVFQANHDIAR